MSDLCKYPCIFKAASGSEPPCGSATAGLRTTALKRSFPGPTLLPVFYRVARCADFRRLAAVVGRNTAERRPRARSGYRLRLITRQQLSSSGQRKSAICTKELPFMLFQQAGCRLRSIQPKTHRRAQPVNSVFPLRALAEQIFLHERYFPFCNAAGKPAFGDKRSIHSKANSQVGDEVAIAARRAPYLSRIEKIPERRDKHIKCWVARKR
jgi:hypothetical protein